MDDTQRTSTWRDTIKVHPVADLFPMMPDAELDATGADIKAHGLKEPLEFCWVETGTPAAHRELVDGRNRLEAMERVGIRLRVRASGLPESLHGKEAAITVTGDPVAHIISKNIHRRHLTKEQQADLIVEAHRAAPVSRQDGGKLAEGRPVNQVKAAAVASAKAMPNGPSKRTVERAFAKAEGRAPAPKPVERVSLLEDDTFEPSEDVEYPAHVLTNALHSIRQAKSVAEAYRKIFKVSPFDREAKKQLYEEINLLIAKWRRVQSTLERNGQNRASTLPQDGRSEDGPL